MEASPLVKLFEYVEPAVRALERFFAEHHIELVAAAQLFMGIDKLDEAHWLPHPAVGIPDFADELVSPAGLAASRYRDRSRLIEDELLDDLSLAGLSALAVAPLNEAVLAHRQGLYRASTRLVFPALEALVRTKLLGNRWGSHTRLNDLRQRILQRVSSEDPTAALPRPMLVSWKLWEKLDAHCFDKVDNAEAYDRFANSQIPNRHACMHGVIDYNTFQHSMNGLILAQYVVQMTQLVKKPSS